MILSDVPLGSDVVNVVYTGAAFSDKNAGVGKVVNVTGISLNGADAGNYSLSATAAATADITAASLTAGAVGHAKLYDGTSLAAVTLTDNRFAGDQLSLTDTGATFSDGSVGDAKPIAVVGIHIAGGADQGNYVLANPTASTTADITAFTDSWSVLPVLPPTIAPTVTTPAAPLLDLTLPAAFGGGAGAGTAATMRPATRALPVVQRHRAAPPASARRTPCRALPRRAPQRTAAAVAQVQRTRMRRPTPTPASSCPWCGRLRRSRPASSRHRCPKKWSRRARASVFHFPEEMTKAAGSPAFRVTLMDGKRLPSWLDYVASSGIFMVTAVPAGVLPMRVLVRAGKQRWAVVINARKR